MSEQVRTYYARHFLNNEEAGGIAFVEAKISEVREGHSSDVWNFDATLTIGDCSRIISLDFDTYGKDQIAEHREKIARLRRVVVAFEKVLLQQFEEVEAA